MAGFSIPLHVNTLPANRQLEARLHHWQRMYELSGGKGFREQPKNKRVRTYFQKLTDQFMAKSA